MKEIKRYLEDRIGQYSFYFEDLDGGYVYGYNENVPMTAAGCMKLPIAISLFKCVEEGLVSLEDRVKVCANDMVRGTGILHEFGEKEYSLFELLTAMLIQSDNTAANKIIDVISMDKINNIIQQLGLRNTKLNRKTIDEKLIKGVVENVTNVTTAHDLCRCWKRLYNNSFLNEENSKKLINILKRQQAKQKVIFYMPDHVKEAIASKPGDMEGIENDTLLLEHEKGNFSFTILSKELPNNVYGTVTLAKAGMMSLDLINNNWNK